MRLHLPLLSPLSSWKKRKKRKVKENYHPPWSSSIYIGPALHCVCRMSCKVRTSLDIHLPTETSLRYSPIETQHVQSTLCGSGWELLNIQRINSIDSTSELFSHENVRKSNYTWIALWRLFYSPRLFAAVPWVSASNMATRLGPSPHVLSSSW